MLRTQRLLFLLVYEVKFFLISPILVDVIICNRCKFNKCEALCLSETVLPSFCHLSEATEKA